MAQTGNLDYQRYAKGGFLLGLALFVVGVLGRMVGSAFLGPLPSWEQTLLFDMEVVGLLLGFFAPLVFGIALPLVE